MGKVLIIGAGVTGCSAANELARQGHSVTLVEQSARVGGKVLDYCCKATTDCSRCGVCVAHSTLSETLAQPAIRPLTAATLLSVRPDGSRLTAELSHLSPALDPARCTACDACVAACPEHCISRYSRGGLVQYSIDHSRCRRHKGLRCDRCLTACKAGAISGRGRSEPLRIQADAALVATGHEIFNPGVIPELGYGRLEGVLHAEEAEAILSRQSFLKTPADNVAFVQCVGSRNPTLGRNYCSSVCCAYAVRMARMLKHRNPQATVTVYYIDLQNFDKTFSPIRAKLAEEGVQLMQGVPAFIDRTAGGRLRVKREGPGGGAPGTAEHDVVVLSVGMTPSRFGSGPDVFPGLVRDPHGFLESSLPNVFTAGTCQAPQSIADSMASGAAAAGRLLPLLPPGRPPKPARRAPAAAAPAASSAASSITSRTLIIGAGLAGCTAARALHELGHPVTVVERSPAPGGASPALTLPLPESPALPDGVELLTETQLAALSGHVGAFQATLRNASNETRPLDCGAVLLCPGIETRGAGAGLFDFDRLFPAGRVAGFMASQNRRDRPRSVGILLDMAVEETRASMEAALRLALQLTGDYPCEVTLFCREIRVAGQTLEALYDDAREAGVTIIRYTGAPRLETREDSVVVSCRDSLVGRDLSITCELVGISPWGLQPAADAGLARLAGVHTDALGQLQANNIHLFPVRSNRPGILVAGSCRGRFAPDDVVVDALAAATQIHSLLSGRMPPIERPAATVAADRCALCLTCLRVCPHGAMVVDPEKRAALCLPEVCRRCGICVGECPAGAIELPALYATEPGAPA